MPRHSKKKRKGFFGKRLQDFEASLDIFESTDDANEPGESGEGSQRRNQNGVVDDDGSFAEASGSATETSTTPKNSKSTVPLKKLKNISAEKISNSDFNKYKDKIVTRSLTKKIDLDSKQPDVELAHGMKLQDFAVINDALLKSVICKECRNPKSKLQVYQLNLERSGLAENLFILCSTCGNKTKFNSSKKLPGQRGCFEVNRGSTLASTSRDKLAKFCAKLDLPAPVSKNSYNLHMQRAEKSAINQADQNMKEAATRLHTLVEKEDPDNIFVDEDGTSIANVAVSVDGTWQKRGHTSKIGIVFVMSVLTGEVLDYEVLSHVCHSCVAHNHLDKESEEFKAWKRAHDPECQINHQGSSGDMEAKGAIAIFSRSIERYKLRYSKFVGDGDSSCFGRVAEAMKENYGDTYEVSKEECVGHVQKRMGAALLDYKKANKGKKLADGKNVGGQGRLTDEVIKRFKTTMVLLTVKTQVTSRK